MDWHALDMEIERGNRDFERRMEEAGNEIQEHLERTYQRCKEFEEARRRDWEELRGELMTAEEKRRLEMDSIQRLFANMTSEYVKVVSSAREDIERKSAEGRAEARAAFDELLAEARAQRQATLRMLDRLPPSKEEGHGN
jgi:tRNA/tmRNA/rRNA uracil-C5-methylase (TrmA/RlmC/RlmD family)